MEFFNTAEPYLVQIRKPFPIDSSTLLLLPALFVSSLKESVNP